MKPFSHIFIGLAAVASLLSCGKSGNEEETVDSTFVVEESVIKTDADGGRIVCEYAISGPKEGRKADVTSSEDWIGVSSVFATEFTLDVEANTTGKDRTGEVQLDCSGVRPLKVRVVQSAKKSERQIYKNYKITVSGITTSTCRVQVEPVDASKTYVYAVVRKADYQKMTAKEYIEARISQIKDMAVQYGSSPADFLSKGTVDTDRLSSDQRPYLYDRTDYCLTAFDLSYNTSKAEFSYSGDIDAVEFSSASAPASSMTFSIKHNGDLLTVTASNSSETFVCDYMSKASWDELDSPDYAAHTYILYSKQYGTFTTYQGSRVIDLSGEKLTKGEKYVVYAVGYLADDTKGGLTTKVNYLEFTY
jgi:hypothetical protein